MAALRRLIAFRTSGMILLVLLGGAAVFQLVVLAGYVPTEMVWGGRLKNEEERTIGGIVSLGTLLLMITLVLVRLGMMGKGMAGLGKYGLWTMAILFALNTVGNVLALDVHETMIFTPITAIASVLCVRLALGEQN